MIEEVHLFSSQDVKKEENFFLEATNIYNKKNRYPSQINEYTHTHEKKKRQKMYVNVKKEKKKKKSKEKEKKQNSLYSVSKLVQFPAL